MQLTSASVLEPTNDKTILVRIIDSYHDKLEKYPNFKYALYPTLKHRKKFYRVFELYFDDVDMMNFTKDEDFKEFCKKEDIEPFSYNIVEKFLEQLNLTTKEDINFYDLVVHCRAGECRSPAMTKNIIYMHQNLNFIYYLLKITVSQSKIL